MFGGEIFLDPKSHVPKFLGENSFGPKHLGTELSQFRNVTGLLCFGTEIFRGRNDPGSKCPGIGFSSAKESELSLAESFRDRSKRPSLNIT